MRKRILSLCMVLVLSFTLLSTTAGATNTLYQDDTIYDTEWAVLRLTNQHRMSIGLSPLSMTAEIQMAANQRAKELPSLPQLAHSRPDGSSWSTVLSDYSIRYNYAAENIAMGYPSAAAVMNGWLNSAGHRQNIETAALTHLGVGQEGRYWSQNFVGSNNCSYSGLTLSQDTITSQVGQDLETLLTQADLQVFSRCTAHGAATLPLIAAMCSGYHPNTAGTQTLTVTLGGQRTTLSVTLVDLPFQDVTNHWALAGIAYAYEHSLFSGTSAITFSPDALMNRAMVVTVLARYDGVNTDGGDTWYAKGRAWAMSQGISDGSDMMGSITREQLATMLYRYAGSPAVSGSLTGFPDTAKVSSYAKDAMTWAVANKLITGDSGYLAPQNNATRAQVATIMMRFCQL